MIYRKQGRCEPDRPEPRLFARLTIDSNGPDTVFVVTSVVLAAAFGFGLAKAIAIVYWAVQ